jgi:hypothetical protein
MIAHVPCCGRIDVHLIAGILMRKLLLPLLVLSLAGCERPDRTGCPTEDLALLGRSEGARAVAATLPKPDCVLDDAETTRYQAGREEGLKRYCLALRGYQLGLDGKTIDPSVCPEGAASELKRGFEVGDNLRNQLRQRDDLLNEARDIERAAASLPKDSAERSKLEEEAAGKRFDARQRENEVEALRGIVAVERWR